MTENDGEAIKVYLVTYVRSRLIESYLIVLVLSLACQGFGPLSVSNIYFGISLALFFILIKKETKIKNKSISNFNIF